MSGERCQYDRYYSIVFNSVEDEELLNAIDRTEGNSKSERGRNLFRAAFAVYKEVKKDE